MSSSYDAEAQDAETASGAAVYADSAGENRRVCRISEDVLAGASGAHPRTSCGAECGCRARMQLGAFRRCHGAPEIAKRSSSECTSAPLTSLVTLLHVAGRGRERRADGVCLQKELSVPQVVEWRR